MLRPDEIFYQYVPARNRARAPLRIQGQGPICAAQRYASIGCHHECAARGDSVKRK